MKVIHQLTIFSAAVLLATPYALGHGFDVRLEGNKILATPENQTNFSNRIFFAPLDPLDSQVATSDHGSIEALPGSGISTSQDTLAIQFLSPLWYSSGGIAQLARNDLSLEATSYDEFGGQLGDPVDISSVSLHPGSFPVSGTDAHSIGWYLSTDGPSIPGGVYGLAYRVTGFKNGIPATPFKASDPLVLIFNTDSLSGSGLNAAGFAIYNAIMRGDFDLDGQRTAADIAPMMQALTAIGALKTATGLNDTEIKAIADVDRDGTITNGDLSALLALLKTGGAGTNAVPEPESGVLAIAALLSVTIMVWSRRKSLEID